MDSSSFPNQDTNVDANNMESPASVNKGKRKGNTNTNEATSKPPPKVQKKNTEIPTGSRSPVWEHFTKTEKDINKCDCNYCGKRMSCLATSGTSNLHTHLGTCKEYKAWNEKKQQNLDQDGGSGNLTLGKVSKEVYREATNEMLVLAQLPLSFVECIAWRHFCRKCKLYEPHSRRTATRDIVEFFVKKREALKKMFKSTKQRVSLTTDIWTANVTGASYMVITAHFIDSNWNLRKFIIGFKNVCDHKGATISAVLLECLAEWGIERIFTITVDNATANTSALTKFKEVFKLLGNDSLVLGGRFMHMRCAAHILNLIVKEGLEEVEASVTAVRNGIQYVRSNTQRRNSFELRVENGRMTRGSLPLDVKTRWNSTYLMLTRAIKYRLAFDKMEAEDKLYNDYFLEVDKDGEERVGPPTSVDWENIERLVSFLIIFYNSTLEVSASTKVCAHKCYDEIVTVEMNLSELCTSNDADVRDKAYEMREKFDKYWDGLKTINKLLIVASVFDPRNKMQFANLCFAELYGKDSEVTKQLTASIEVVLRQLFEEYTGNLTGQREGPLFQSQRHFMAAATSHNGQEVNGDLSDKMEVAADDHSLKYKRMRVLYKELVKDKGIKDASNELQLYLKEDVADPNVLIGAEFDVLSWWKVNTGRFPILSEIAKDVLAMQVSSVASESAFSTSGRILDPHRSCLSHYMIEVLMCTEQWLKDDIHFTEKGLITIQQLLAEVELHDTLEKEFGTVTY